MTKEEIMEKLGVMEDEPVIELWNECIQDKHLPDDEVFFNDEAFFNEYFSNPYDAALAIGFGDWRRVDEYVVFDGCGNIRSFWYWNDKNSPIDEDILVGWLMENPEKLEAIGLYEDDEEEDD